WIVERGGGDDRLPGSDRFGDHPAREGGADVGDVSIVAAARHPEARSFVARSVIVELDVAALCAGELGDQTQRFLQKRLDLVLRPELEEVAIEIALQASTAELLRCRGLHPLFISFRPPEPTRAELSPPSTRSRPPR